MKTRNRFYSIISIIMLVTLLLPQGATVAARRALAGNRIPFTEHTIDSDFDGADFVYATDVDGDGDADVLATACSADDITWWENDGSQNFTEHTIDGYFNCAVSVYATNMDGDGDVDVLGAAWLADDITWWENDGSQNFTEHTIDDDFHDAESVYATDVDGDGDVDVLGAAFYADDITWWENDGSQNFTEHTIDGYFDGAESVYTTDMDGDGDVDVLGAANHDNEITWWEQGPPVELIFLPVVLKNAGPPSSPPVLDDISNPGGTGDYTVSWSSVSGATEYTLQEDDNEEFASPTTVYSGASTSTTITGKDIGTYYYRVQAANSFGSSPWSNVVSVQVTQSPTPTPTAEPKTWVNVINHCSCTVFVDFTGPETKSVTVFANSTSVVFLTPGTYHYDIDSIGCGSDSGFVTIPHTVQFNFHIYCTSSLDDCSSETGQERDDCATTQLVR